MNVPDIELAPNRWTNRRRAITPTLVLLSLQLLSSNARGSEADLVLSSINRAALSALGVCGIPCQQQGADRKSQGVDCAVQLVRG